MKTSAVTPSSAILYLLQKTIRSTMELAEKQLTVQVQQDLETQKAESNAKIISELEVDLYA